MSNAYIDTTLLDKALRFAIDAHADSERRGKGFPYIVHPLEAVSIVATMTPDQEMLAAAALHDTIEDTDVTYEQLRDEFGKRVADLVLSETDQPIPGLGDNAPWRVRKQAALDRLNQATRDEKIVAMGDKLSNMRAMARDYHELGNALWDRFHAPNGIIDHAWRYRQLAKAFSTLKGTEAYAEFVHLVSDVFGDCDSAQ